jgi:hypothetical protein
MIITTNIRVIEMARKMWKSGRKQSKGIENYVVVGVG